MIDVVQIERLRGYGRAVKHGVWGMKVSSALFAI